MSDPEPEPETEQEMVTAEAYDELYRLYRKQSVRESKLRFVAIIASLLIGSVIGGVACGF